MGTCFSATKVSGSHGNAVTVNKNRKGAAKPKSETATANPLRHKASSRHVPCGKRTDFGYEKDFDQRYSLGKLLGHGQFGYTYVGIDKANGDRVAVKRLEKSKMVLPIAVEDVKREVKILKALTGHENVVQFYNAFEDGSYVYIVMELCEGGELLDRILAKKDSRYTERDAAVVVRQMLKVAAECHLHGLVHRDMKPENFLFKSTKEDSPLKATDFGLSDFIKPGKKFHDIVGSAYYVAPEVLKRKSGPQSDVWSIGVITYILLCGRRPFWDKTEDGIFKEVLRKKPDFHRKPWPTISNAAKDFLKRLLVKDPRARLTAAQALSHPWVREGGEALEIPIDISVLSNMRQFVKYSRMKQFALRTLASTLNEEELADIKDQFDAIDVDKNGSISLEEMRQALAKDLPWKLKESRVLEILQAIDSNTDGLVDFREFVAATLHVHQLEEDSDKWQQLSQAAFEKFDIDKDGYITTEELRMHTCLRGSVDPLLEEADIDKDGKISLPEFRRLLRTASMSSKNVLRKKPDFRRKPWPTISNAAKDFVKKLLVKDPRARLTAAQALSHPWVREGGEALEIPIDISVLSNMRQFVKYSRFKQFALRALASTLNEEELADIKDQFDAIDVDKNGSISLEEMRQALAKDLPWKLKESRVLEILQAIDNNTDGLVDFREFVAATLHVHQLEEDSDKWQQLSQAAFEKFDLDKDGYITPEELRMHTCLRGSVDPLLEEADIDKDGKISLPEFRRLLRTASMGSQNVSSPSVHRRQSFIRCLVKECDILTQYKRCKPESTLSAHRWKGGRSVKLEGSDHAPVFMSLHEIPDVSLHSTPPLSARYVPMVHGIQQTVAAKHLSVLMKRQVSKKMKSFEMAQEDIAMDSTCERKEPVNRAGSSTSPNECHFPPSQDQKAKSSQWSQLSLRSFFQKSANLDNGSSVKVVNDSCTDYSNNQAEPSQPSPRLQETPTVFAHSSSPKKYGLDTDTCDQDLAGPNGSSTKEEMSNVASLEWQRIQQLMQNSIPICKGYKEPCIARVVKKQGPNFGRRFYVCAHAEVICFH
ncbi:Calcium-dependent protein kinase 28 [Glycine soja]|uniref:non-specific serine/threonine protein kinase n=1 Tax=Glycine soja TaxID=3848 RepID=A0A0B2PI25_GLYSO|nr:Calcium-dependent protein kinase 28 [Glycine soja]